MDARWDHSGTWRPACFADPRLQEIMENTLEITLLLEVHRGILLALYWSYIRIMEKKMEATTDIFCQGVGPTGLLLAGNGDMEKKMENNYCIGLYREYYEDPFPHS